MDAATPATAATPPLNRAAADVVYEHARWLLDGQYDRLSSIESRAATLIGWASAQVAASAVVASLVSGALDGWQLVVTVALVALGGCLATCGAWTALNKVITTASVSAVEVDFASTVDAAARYRDGADALLVDRFQEAIRAPGPEGAPAVLPAVASVVNKRASALRSAVAWQTRGLVVHATSVVALTIFLIQKGIT